MNVYEIVISKLDYLKLLENYQELYLAVKKRIDGGCGDYDINLEL